MSPEAVRHRVAVGVAATAIAASIAGWSPSPTAALMCAGAAAIVGLPHGALDVVVGPKGRSARGFFALYGALAGLVIAAWLVAPVLMLVLFLAASWYHFASGDTEHHRSLGPHAMPLGIATGGAALAFPFALHSDIVAPIFDDLLLRSASVDPSLLAGIGLIMATVVVAAAGVACIKALRVGGTASVVEVAAIVLVAATAHPLIAFSVYFAFWHSPRHLMRLDLDRTAIAPTAAATVGTIAAGAAGWVLLAPTATTATQVLFIGLAAVTAPHLIVTEQLPAPQSTFRQHRVALPA